MKTSFIHKLYIIYQIGFNKTVIWYNYLYNICVKQGLLHNIKGMQSMHVTPRFSGLPAWKFQGQANNCTYQSLYFVIKIMLVT